MPPVLLMVFWFCFISRSLSALEDLDWLPLNHTFFRVSEMVLKAAVSTLASLQESGAMATGVGILPLL